MTARRRTTSKAPKVASPPVSSALFETALGTCGIAWTPLGLAWVELPGRDAAATKKRMATALAARASTPSDEPAPDWVDDTVARITAYLAGAPGGLDVIRLDTRGVAPFFRRVYEVTRAIPRGEVKSYAAVAEAAGSPAASRAVGQAMAKNPWPVVVPCHRVVGSAGKPGGFSAPGGLLTKAQLLALEGAPALNVPRKTARTALKR